MTSETTTPTSRRTTTAEDDARTGVQAAVAEVRGALEGVSRQVPEVARASRGAVDDLFKAIETGSDARVSAGVTLSLGLAIGMLLGGAPRLLILAALAPVAVMGLVMGERRSKANRAGTAS